MKRFLYYQIVLSMKLTLLGMTLMLTETTQITPGELEGVTRSGNVETCASHGTDVIILRTTNVLSTAIWKHLTQEEDLLQDIQEYLQGLSFVVRWIAKTFVMIEYLCKLCKYNHCLIRDIHFCRIQNYIGEATTTPMADTTTKSTKTTTKGGIVY